MKSRICIFICAYIFCFLCFADAHIILMGAPGAGKGTLSQELKRNKNYVHISPGNLLREEIANSTELGKQIEGIVRSGEYVSDHIVFDVMKKRILPGLDDGKYLIIDGYPRSKESLSTLEKFLKEYKIEDKTVVINLDVSESGALERVANRIVCPSCAEVYKFRKEQSLCSKCGNSLEFRMGDNEKITRKRYNHYINTVIPLYNEMSTKFQSLTINTEKNKVPEIYYIVEKFVDAVA